MKEKVLDRLKKSDDKYISGEALSEELGVSRTSVWKYIKELKNEGYKIEASSRKGYKLVSVSDVLNQYEVQQGLDTQCIGKEILHFEEIDSTNNYAKTIGNQGYQEGTVVIADRQTTGRGRLGRSWDSQNNKGIWMSILLRPSLALEDVQVITLAASIAIVAALKKVTGITTGIKWPNDIIFDGKKVCGILVEMSSEIQKINYLVVGMGINVNQCPGDFPEEIRDKAVSLKMCAWNKGITVEFFKRSEIIKAVITEMENIYNYIKEGNIQYIIDLWKQHSVTLGKNVKIISKDHEIVGIAEDINENGWLIVKLNDGTRKEIISGEISVRGIMGYI